MGLDENRLPSIISFLCIINLGNCTKASGKLGLCEEKEETRCISKEKKFVLYVTCYKESYSSD